MRLDAPAPQSVLTYVTFKHVLQRRDMHLHPIQGFYLLKEVHFAEDQA